MQGLSQSYADQGVLKIGDAALYYSRSKGEWIPAVVQGHNSVPTAQGGSQLISYKLDIQPSAELDRVRASHAIAGNTSSDKMFPIGAPVWYCSQSSGKWLPSTVQGLAMSPTGETVYNLDRKPDAHPSRVKYRDQGTPPVSSLVSSLAPSAGQSNTTPSRMPRQNSTVVRERSVPAPFFSGEHQQGYGPDMWGVSLEQLEAILKDPRFSGGGFWNRFSPRWASSPQALTVRHVVEQIIRPDTASKGVGYAMLQNAGQPLHARIIVCHSWEDDYQEFVQALQASGVQGPFWLCAMAMYQGDGKPGECMGPLAEAYIAALSRAECLLCMAPAESNIFTRLWCLFQISTAMLHGVPVRISKKKGKAWSMVNDALLDHCREPIQSNQALCGPKDSMEHNPDAQLLRNLIESSPGSFAGLDRRVEEPRLETLEKRRERLAGEGWKGTEICRLYDEVIDIVRGRLGMPPYYQDRGNIITRSVTAPPQQLRCPSAGNTIGPGGVGRATTPSRSPTPPPPCAIKSGSATPRRNEASMPQQPPQVRESFTADGGGGSMKMSAISPRVQRSPSYSHQAIVNPMESQNSKQETMNRPWAWNQASPDFSLDATQNAMSFQGIPQSAAASPRTAQHQQQSSFSLDETQNAMATMAIQKALASDWVSMGTAVVGSVPQSQRSGARTPPSAHHATFEMGPSEPSLFAQYGIPPTAYSSPSSQHGQCMSQQGGYEVPSTAFEPGSSSQFAHYGISATSFENSPAPPSQYSQHPSQQVGYGLPQTAFAPESASFSQYGVPVTAFETCVVPRFPGGSEHIAAFETVPSVQHDSGFGSTYY